MGSNFFLKSESLRISHFSLSDAAFILELLNTEGWLQYIGDRNVRTIMDAEGYLLNGPISDYKKNGFGLFKIASLDSGVIIGMCGLLKREYLEHPDIGFALLPQYGGQGLMYETCEYLLRWYHDVIGLERIDAIVQPDNSRSIRLLERLGFAFTDTLERDGDVLRLYQKT